jgi:hypothetical protein
VSVLLGRGDGTFAPARSYAAGADPRSLGVGDFNGDGVLDLAIAHGDFSQNTISVLPGRGDGTFAGPQDYAAGVGPWSIAAGDFNGDGLSDLAVVNCTHLTVSVLLSQRDGTFAAPQSYAAGFYPYAVAVGDFNGDGVPDLAVVNTDPDDTVTVLLNAVDWGGGPSRVPRSSHPTERFHTIAARLNWQFPGAPADTHPPRAFVLAPQLATELPPLLVPAAPVAAGTRPRALHLVSRPDPRLEAFRHATDALFKDWADPIEDDWAAHG